MSKNDSFKVDSKDAATVAARPDVRELMAEIRQKVKNSVGENRDFRLPFVPHRADESGGARKAGEIPHSEELRYLNRHYNYPISTYRPDLITSHRPGLGSLIVKAKRKVLHFFWQVLFKPYFDAEREYQGHLVRLLNDLSHYIDSRDAFIFWDLIKKIDYDVSRAVEKIESIADTQNSARLAAETQLRDQSSKVAADLSTLGNSFKELSSRLAALESNSARLAGELNRVSSGGDSAPSKVTTGSQGRGFISTSEILPKLKTTGDGNRFSAYASMLGQLRGSVLDISKDSGSLGDLLKRNGVDYHQITGNPIAHLESIADQSLGAVIGIKALDRMDIGSLKNFLTLTKVKVRSGGVVLFEMTNPESIVGLNQDKISDPSLVTSLSPDSLKLVLEFAGFKVREIHKVSPFSNDEVLKELELNEYLTPKWGLMIESLNLNIKKLNTLMYGHKSYCILAEV